MPYPVFEKETLLDISVNIIPLFILLFFIVLFAFFNPWHDGPAITAIGIALVVVPLIVLSAVTYVAARQVG